MPVPCKLPLNTGVPLFPPLNTLKHCQYFTVANLIYRKYNPLISDFIFIFINKIKHFFMYFKEFCFLRKKSPIPILCPPSFMPSYTNGIGDTCHLNFINLTHEKNKRI